VPAGDIDLFATEHIQEIEEITHMPEQRGIGETREPVARMGKVPFRSSGPVFVAERQEGRRTAGIFM
jgi:hypothetical protein